MELEIATMKHIVTVDLDKNLIVFDRELESGLRHLYTVIEVKENMNEKQLQKLLANIGETILFDSDHGRRILGL